MSKYRNHKITMLGRTFDSKAEWRRWVVLEERRMKGEIQDLERQRAFVLAASVQFADEKRAKPALRYVADFFYQENGKRVVEDVKSPATAKTAAFRIKRHLMKALYGLDVKVVR